MKLFTTTSNLIEQMVAWRRDFHQYPETGWTEFRTASIIAHELHKLGLHVQIGKEVVSEERMGVPSDDELAVYYENAKSNGGYVKYMEKMVGGYTGVVATIKGKKQDLPLLSVLIWMR